MRMSYYPGCSLTGTAREYQESVREVAHYLDIELVELADWNCCGASSAHMTSHELATKLSARNLQLAQQVGEDLLVPCSACYSRLMAADHELRQQPEEYGLTEYNPTFEIVHISQLLSRTEVLVELAQKRKRSLGGLPLACYYGCLSLRPPKVTGAQDFEQPQRLDQLVNALGGHPVAFSHKTECCGGSLTMARPDITYKLVNDVVQAARIGGAQAIVTDCPMCHANLETRQAEAKPGDTTFPMPVFYSTELIAFTLAEQSDTTRFNGHLISIGSVLSQTVELTSELQG